MSCELNTDVSIPDFRARPGSALPAESLVERWYDQLAWIHGNLLGHPIPQRPARENTRKAKIPYRTQSRSKESDRLEFFASNGSDSRVSRGNITRKSRAQEKSPSPAQTYVYDGAELTGEDTDGTQILEEPLSGPASDEAEDIVNSFMDEKCEADSSREEKIEKLPDLGLKGGPGPHFSVFAKPKPIKILKEVPEVSVVEEKSKQANSLIAQEGQLRHSFSNDMTRLRIVIDSLLPGSHALAQGYNKLYLTRSGWELRRSQLHPSKPRGICIHVFDVVPLDDITVLHDVLELQTSFHINLLNHYRDNLLPVLGNCYATLDTPYGRLSQEGVLKVNVYVDTSFTQSAVENIKTAWMKLMLIRAIIKVDSERADRQDDHILDVRIATGELCSAEDSLEIALRSTIRETVEASISVFLTGGQ